MLNRLASGCLCAAALVALTFPAGARADISVVEGQSFTMKVADTGGCSLASAAVTWGDGTPDSPGDPTDDGSGVQGTHLYAEAGSYNGSVHYTCNNFGGAFTATFTATVQDAPLAATGRDISGQAGQSLSVVVAHFDDGDKNATPSKFSTLIAWGDGATTAGSVATAIGGGFDVTGTHTYTGTGSFTVSTKITDHGGSTVTTTSTAQIGAGAPAPAPIVGPRIVGEPGKAGTYRCFPGTWTGIAPDATASAFSYTWLRRDGARYREVARGPTYRPTSTAVIAALRGASYYACLVEAHNASGTGTKLSPAVLLAPNLRDPLRLLQSSYGDFRIRGIDVFQEVQPNSGAQQFLFPFGAFPALPGGGTPTGLTFGPGGLVGVNKQGATYQGVLLDRTKPTTAVVYVDTKNTAATNPTEPLEVSLSLMDGNRVVRGPITTPFKNPRTSVSDVVLASERADPSFSLRIPVPADWMLQPGSTGARATFSLRATVGFPASSRAFGLRECDAAGCGDNDAYRLDGIRVGPLLRGLTVQTLDLRRTGQPAPPSPAFVMRGARQTMPGGERMQFLPYAAQLDITSSSDAVPGAKLCKGTTTRACREALVGAQVIFWSDNNPATQRLGFLRTPLHVYDLLMGVHNYQAAPASFIEPGWSSAASINTLPILGENFTAFGLQPYMALTHTGRPLTAAAHELGHQLTAPHADQTCGGNINGQVAEPWPPDNAGRLQGALANIRPAFNGSPSSLRSVSVDGTNGLQLYDLMSYCAPNSPETGVGVSARNWDRFFSAQIDYEERLASANFLRARATAAPAAVPPGLLAVGVVGSDTGAITRVGRSKAVPAAVPSSSLKLRSLGADGHVLREDGVAVRALSEQDALANFSGAVDPGATTVELVRDGTVLDRVQRSDAPSVRLLAPSAGMRVRRGRPLVVRWRASDADSSGLDAKVEFSPDDGHLWRTVLDGPSRGSARVPSSFLAGSRRARVRVTVSDGFAEGVAVSQRFRVDPRPPAVTIERPIRGGTLRAGHDVLLGAARDDLGRPIRGRALTWFAGRRRLGHGERLRAAGLAAGRTTLRLVARSSSGATGTARARVRVVADPPRLTQLRAPRLVPAKARKMVIRVRAATPANLSIAGHRYRIGPKSRRLLIALPHAPRRGILRLRLVLSGPGGRTTGRLEVVRA